MSTILASLVAAGMCAATAVQASDTPYGVTGVRKPHRGDGDNAAGAITYYQNTNRPYFGVLLLPLAHAMDDASRFPGPGAGRSNILINQVVFGVVSDTHTAADVWLGFWEDWQFATPGSVLRNPVTDRYIAVHVPLCDFPPACNYNWLVTVDLSGLPGGGIIFPNGNPGPDGVPDDFYFEQYFFVPGTTTFLAPGTVSCGFAGGDANGDGTSEGPQVGDSRDLFFVDINDDYIFTYVTSTGDPDESRNFGGGSNAANLYLELSYVAACDPCDMNCDGTVNFTDIQGFVDVVNGGAGCSACAGDTNSDGSINLFDIQDFVNCLGSP